VDGGGDVSADNWAVCPKCKIEIDAEADANIKVAQDAYGVASAEEYVRNPIAKARGLSWDKPA